MSRTYRRKKFGKGKRPYNDWITHEWVKDESSAHELIRKVYYYNEGGIVDYKKVSCIGYDYYYKPLPESIKLINIAKYHSDNASLMTSPPKWFLREFCNRPFRAKAKAELKRLMKSEDYYDYNFDPHKKTAMWMWW